jgi:hypothetical protein
MLGSRTWSKRLLTGSIVSCPSSLSRRYFGNLVQKAFEKIASACSFISLINYSHQVNIPYLDLSFELFALSISRLSDGNYLTEEMTGNQVCNFYLYTVCQHFDHSIFVNSSFVSTSLLASPFDMSLDMRACCTPLIRVS